MICFPSAFTYRPRLKSPTSTSIAIAAAITIPTGRASHMDIPLDIMKLATAYAPKAEITPCAKLVVNEVLNIIVIARVTKAVTHIAGIDPSIVLSK